MIVCNSFAINFRLSSSRGLNCVSIPLCPCLLVSFFFESNENEEDEDDDDDDDNDDDPDVDGTMASNVSNMTELCFRQH